MNPLVSLHLEQKIALLDYFLSATLDFHSVMKIMMFNVTEFITDHPKHDA